MDYIDLSSLHKVLSSLNAALVRYSENTNDDCIRDSVIQRYEYTYHLAIKMLQRYLEMTAAEIANVDEMTFKELIRTSLEKGLLRENLETWDVYRLRRNLTSHTYDVEKALLVVQIVPDFIEEIKFLLTKLES